MANPYALSKGYCINGCTTTYTVGPRGHKVEYQGSVLTTHQEVVNDKLVHMCHKCAKKLKL